MREDAAALPNRSNLLAAAYGRDEPPDQRSLLLISRSTFLQVRYVDEKERCDLDRNSAS